MGWVTGTFLRCWWKCKLVQLFWKIGLALSPKVDLIMWTYKWNLLSLSVPDVSGTCPISLAHLWFQPQSWMVPTFLLLLASHLEGTPHIPPYSAPESSPVSVAAKPASKATESRGVNSPGDNCHPMRDGSHWRKAVIFQVVYSGRHSVCFSEVLAEVRPSITHSTLAFPFPYFILVS